MNTNNTSAQSLNALNANAPTGQSTNALTANDPTAQCLTQMRDFLRQHVQAVGDFTTQVEGLAFHRHHNGAAPKPHFYEPTVIVVAQGRKTVNIGQEFVTYAESSCFITGVNMPVASCVVEATADTPYLSVSLNLDKSIITQYAAQVTPASDQSFTYTPGAAVQQLDAPILSCFVRLLHVSQDAEEATLLAPLIVQEIHYRLLKTPFGQQLRALNTIGTQGHKINQAIHWLKDNYSQPLHVDELAQKMNMATSTFHKHFKDITTMSPLQYQKQLRLLEAQNLLLKGHVDVSGAAYAVGYESPTQFTREYKRLFGDPPLRDLKKSHAAVV